MLLLFALILFTAFFTYYDYLRTIEIFEKQEKSRLLVIAKTVACQIDGEQHSALYEENKKKDDIKTSDQDETYQKIHEILKTVKQTNNLPTDIYTAVFSEKEQSFSFVVTSGVRPYFRHKWKKFNERQRDEIHIGGTIDKYETENGIWISAFAPINDHGESRAIIQVDTPFTPFIKSAQEAALQKTWVIGGFLVLASFLLYLLMVRIIRKEIKTKKKMALHNMLIENKNKNIIASIKSAKRIQESILPPYKKIQKEFPDFFVVYKPKDIVSGDFFWYYTIGDISYFAIADCTGHGVPGAMVTMLGQAILRDIIKGSENISPAEILHELDVRLERSINHKKYDIPEGMDISMCRMSRKDNTIEYAGAMRPMIKVRKGDLEIIPGNKYSIGGILDKEKTFENRLVNVEPGDRYYFYTDGYCDQFGGEKGKKYMTKRFREFVSQSQDLRMEDQRYLFNYEFHHWQREEEQVDDVLVAGFEIPGVDYSKTSFPELKIVA
ncbi:MAG: SpoIIE family protein phosphatase [Bacteroidota bacterium]